MMEEEMEAHPSKSLPFPTRIFVTVFLTRLINFCSQPGFKTAAGLAAGAAAGRVKQSVQATYWLRENSESAALRRETPAHV